MPPPGWPARWLWPHVWRVWALPLAHAQRIVRVGAILDGPWYRNAAILAQSKEEIPALTIVLIDRIKIEIEENGRAPQDAVMEAGQRRLRPILLTTATTVAGLLPLWYGGGPMWEPMAISIIFGLLFATVLTLGLVPILYSFFFRVSFAGYRYAQGGS